MIKIDNTLFIDVHEFGYALYMKYIGKDKNGEKIEKTTTFGCYQNLQTALKAAMKFKEMMKLGDGEYTLKEAISIVTEVSDRFSRLLEEAIKDDAVK